MDQKSLELGTKYELTASGNRIVKGLYPQSIAREEEHLFLAIEYGESEHAAKPLDTVFAPLFPGVNDHFRVTGSPKFMAVIGELSF